MARGVNTDEKITDQVIVGKKKKNTSPSYMSVSLSM